MSKNGDHAWIDKTGTVKMKMSDFPDWELGPQPDFQVPVVFVIRKDRTKRAWLDLTGKITPFAADDEKLSELSGRAFVIDKAEKNQMLIHVSEYVDNDKNRIAQLFLDSKGGYYGILDKDGKVIVRPVFFKLSPFDPKSGLARASFMNGDQVIEGYVNKQGVFVVIKGKSGSEW